ncbi:MAG: chalcone isomerase family protein [Alphaproteobacteria bacterium]|jgi:hypothetical protein
MPDRRLWSAVLVLLCLAPGPATAGSAEALAARYFANPQKVGEAVLRYLFWDVYRAELFAPAARWRPDAPFALTLNYLRDLDGADIADRTISEMRDQGFSDEKILSDWQARLRAVFPDVSDGTRLTGVRDRGGRTIFYRDGRKIGEFDDPSFTRRFFDIWLGEKTSEPALRRALLGGS